MKTPIQSSSKKRVRDFEKSNLRKAHTKAHEDGNHEEYEKRDCPKCDYDGPHYEKRSQ